MWVKYASNASLSLDPFCYGNYLNDNEKMVSDITSSELPVDFPLPCTFQKSARYTVCLCRVKSIGCYEYCKCVKISQQ